MLISRHRCLNCSLYGSLSRAFFTITSQASPRQKEILFIAQCPLLVATLFLDRAVIHAAFVPLKFLFIFCLFNSFCVHFIYLFSSNFLFATDCCQLFFLPQFISRLTSTRGKMFPRIKNGDFTKRKLICMIVKRRL